MNHIKIVAASLTHIHKIKNLKGKLYNCTAGNNTGNKLESQEPKEKTSLNITEPNSSPIAEISVLWDGGDCNNVNIFSFKFGQHSNSCATHIDQCKHT